MIGKISKGKSFRGCLNYLLKKEDAQLLESNLGGQNVDELNREFGAIGQTNPRVARAVFHASLSTPAHEAPTDDQWRALASDYLEGMGFDDNQYLLIKHQDTSHQHVHLVTNRVKINGECVSQRFDYRRSEEMVRQLEQRYSLEPTPSSWEHERRGQTQGEQQQLARTGESSQRKELQSAIERASQGEPTMPQLLDRLKDDGIDAQVKFTRTGQVKGISYGTEDGFAFSGTKLGQAYSFPGLQKHRGVSYDPSMNREVVTANRSSPATPQQQREQQQQRTQTVAPIAAYFLNNEGETHFEGSDHTINWDEQSQTMSLTENSSGRTVMKAEWDGEEWQALGSSLTREKTDYFENEVAQQAQQRRHALEEEQRQRQRERQRGLEL